MPAVVRWMACFITKDVPSLRDVRGYLQLLEHEFGPAATAMERAAEPLWHGASAILRERPHVELGVVFPREAVARFAPEDVWSVPGRDGRLRPYAAKTRAPTPQTWARWAKRKPLAHGEVFIASGARPVGVALARRLKGNPATRFIHQWAQDASVRVWYIPELH